MTVGAMGLLRIARDRGLWLMMLAQPLILGVLIALHARRGTRLGTDLLLHRDDVDLARAQQRRAEPRSRPEALRPGTTCVAFVPGPISAQKAALYTLVGIAFILLLTCLYWCSHQVLSESVAADFHKTSPIWLFTVTLLCYTCGLGMGLLISALARTEEAAVAALRC